MDVADADGWETVVTQAEEAWGPVRVLVDDLSVVAFAPTYSTGHEFVIDGGTIVGQVAQMP